MGKLNTTIITPKKISEILSISIQTAYKIVRELNDEIKKLNEKREAEGEIPFLIFTSKTYTQYFYDRYYGEKFLKIKELEKKLGIKYWEAKAIYSQIKTELTSQGYKIVKGRIPEKYLKEKFL